MKRIIAVDGIEGSGKTALIERLVKEHPYAKRIKIHDRRSPFHSVIENLSNEYGWPYCGCFEHFIVAKVLTLSEGVYILDRSIVSSAVYGLATDGSAEKFVSFDETCDIVDMCSKHYICSDYDINFINLSCSYHVSQERVGFPRNSNFTEDYHNSVSDAFLKMNRYLAEDHKAFNIGTTHLSMDEVYLIAANILQMV